MVNGSKKAEVDPATGHSKGYAAYWYTAKQIEALLPSMEGELTKLAQKRTTALRASERAAKTAMFK